MINYLPNKTKKPSIQILGTQPIYPTQLPTKEYTNNPTHIHNLKSLTKIHTHYLYPNQYIIIHITNTNLPFLGSWFIHFCVSQGVIRKSQGHTHLASLTYQTL